MAGQGCDWCWQEVWEKDPWPPTVPARPLSPPPTPTSLGARLSQERAWTWKGLTGNQGHANEMQTSCKLATPC